MDNLERDLELASKALQNAAGRTAQGLENRYGEAYQRLVRAGLRPQIRKRYRTKKG